MDFYTQISNYYNDIFPLNKAQISFVESYLGNDNQKKSLLDIGCGTGGLPIALYNYFDAIIAIDTNKKMLEIAQIEAKGKKIDFLNTGMLDIDNQFPYNAFDIVLCFGNTVVHLQSIDQIETFFKKVKTVLVQGGKFLFQIINYDNVLDNNLVELPIIENERIKFDRNYSVDKNGMIDFSTTLTIKNTREELDSNIKLFPVRKAQIDKALQNAGFESINVFSSFNKMKYNIDSLPLIFECY